jgi:hypothetical protein
VAISEAERQCFIGESRRAGILYWVIGRSLAPLELIVLGF